MDWSLHAFTRSWLAGLLVALLMLTGCAPLPDDEAAWVLEDLAAREGESRLKERTPDPARRPIAYAIQGRDYQGDLYLPGEPPLAGIVLVPGVAARSKDDPRLVAIRAELDALNLANRDLPRLRARLILLHGTDDTIIPYTESMALVAAVPRAELFLINGLAHVDVRPFGLDRRAMWRAIRALLAQRNNPGEGRR